MTNILQAEKKLPSFGTKRSFAEDAYIWPHYTESDIERTADFLRGSTFSEWNLGGIYEETPFKYACKMGASFGIFVNSGTAGLHAALMSLELQPGDKVVVPAMTFIRSVTPLVHMGLIPVLCDIDKDTGNLDPESLADLPDEGIRAVIPVHMWGVPCAMEKISEIARVRNWSVIEDFSHAHFSATGSRYAGSIGDVGFASLQRKKSISVGEGGLVVTSNPDVFKRLQDITSPGSFGIEPGQPVDFSGFGLNMRMSPTSAVLADSVFDRVDEILSRRCHSAEIIRNMLKCYPEVFQIHDIPPHVNKVSWYALRIKSRVSVNQLREAAKGTRWRFGNLEYPAIAEHRFWNKESGCWPFSQRIRPESQESAWTGMKEYLNGRTSVKLPTWLPENWTEREVGYWGNELKNIVSRLKI